MRALHCIAKYNLLRWRDLDGCQSVRPLYSACMPQRPDVGTELDLFAAAENWKRYWRSHLRAFVRGVVLEVGAGIGSNTRLLADTDWSTWTCLEPDPRLRTDLQSHVGERRETRHERRYSRRTVLGAAPPELELTSCRCHA